MNSSDRKVTRVKRKNGSGGNSGKHPAETLSSKFSQQRTVRQGTRAEAVLGETKNRRKAANAERRKKSLGGSDDKPVVRKEGQGKQKTGNKPGKQKVKKANRPRQKSQTGDQMDKALDAYNDKANPVATTERLDKQMSEYWEKKQAASADKTSV